jgi:PAS domain S-box-containing protein
MAEQNPRTPEFKRMSKAELAERLQALQVPAKKKGREDAREAEFQAVLHELEVYQIELEMQNRELRESRELIEESHDRYVDLYDFSPIGYATLSDQGIIQDLNLTAASLLGVERRWLLQRSLAPWILPAELPAYRKHLKCGVGDNKVTTVLHIVRHHDKRILPVELSSVAWIDPTTGSLVLLTAITDLSERRKAEAERDRFFELSNDLLCVMNSRGFFERINPAWERTLGYTPSEFFSSPYTHFLHPEDHARTAAEFEEVKRGRPLSPGFQNRFMKKGGGIVWLTWSGVFTENVFYGAARDTTRETSNLEALNSAVDELKRERKLREDFVSALTHDLRTPLTAAKMSVQLAARKAIELDPKLVSTALESIDRIEQMIRDLLDANRIRANEPLPMTRTRFDLVRLSAALAEELSMIHRTRVVLKSSESKLFGMWSKPHLRRVIENLVNNAAKYGTRKEPITLSVERVGEEEVALSVHNRGKAIAREDQLSLFEQYRRTDSAIASGHKGWGVGLTLVRGIVEAHGGKLTVSSEPAQGTTFTAILPVDSGAVKA